jgi:hypothetical protein
LAARLQALTRELFAAEARAKQLEELAAAVGGGGAGRALFHEAELVEVRCTDTLLALDALQDEASTAADGGERSAVRDAIARLRRIADALSRVKAAAANAD